ncbi:MAG: tRNA(Met) cytidine acetyltransferase TmcA [Haloferacaceae archaeon]
MVDLATHARALRAEARVADERRLLVLTGDRTAGLRAADEALSAAGLAATVVSDCADLGFGAAERLPPPRSDDLLGTTREAVVLDCHAGFAPNVLGRVVGAVDGGGLLVLVVPPLDRWPEMTTDFDEGLAVPPFDADDAGGRFRRRLVDTLRVHPGISIVDVDAGRLVRDGRTDDVERPARERPGVPADTRFPAAAYEACLTADQARAVRALEHLYDPDEAVVVSADRGRGKSAAAGLAAGALAAAGRSVLVTAPDERGAGEVFVRARALLDGMNALDADASDDRDLRTAAGGRVWFAPPPAAAERTGDADAVIVDEAAGIPVRRLSALLDAPAIAFVTTVHGYEGAGRGFAVRFRDRLAASDFAVTDVTLDEPIRYARDDPVEAWSFRALLLDARPAVEPAVAGAAPETASFAALDPDDLLDDEHRLREAFGLLALAHYRTEPDDLARLLDAPNVRVRALIHEGHVVSVALLAREGGLDADRRRAVYEGERIRGHMIPDVLTSQLRDEGAGVPVGDRVLRIATHGAVRSRGLGSRLLDELARGVRDADGDGSGVDWLGVGFGATPRLLDFWHENGYGTVHLSTTRNERSGEYSAVMLRPTSDAGRALRDRHARWFRDRAAGVLADPLRDCDPDVARGALRATDAPVDPSLDDHEWRVVAAAAYGPGLYVTAPGAVGRLAVAGLVEDLDGLGRTAGRLLVRKVLQGHPFERVADELDFVSRRAAMRALGEACKPLVAAYGGAAARAERERYADGENGNESAGDGKNDGGDAGKNDGDGAGPT